MAEIGTESVPHRTASRKSAWAARTAPRRGPRLMAKGFPRTERRSHRTSREASGERGSVRSPGIQRHSLRFPIPIPATTAGRPREDETRTQRQPPELRLKPVAAGATPDDPPPLLLGAGGQTRRAAKPGPAYPALGPEDAPPHRQACAYSAAASRSSRIPREAPKSSRARCRCRSSLPRLARRRSTSPGVHEAGGEGLRGTHSAWWSGQHRRHQAPRCSQLRQKAQNLQQASHAHPLQREQVAAGSGWSQTAHRAEASADRTHGGPRTSAAHAEPASAGASKTAGLAAEASRIRGEDGAAGELDPSRREAAPSGAPRRRQSIGRPSQPPSAQLCAGGSSPACTTIDASDAGGVTPTSAAVGTSCARWHSRRTCRSSMPWAGSPAPRARSPSVLRKRSSQVWHRMLPSMLTRSCQQKAQKPRPQSWQKFL